MSQDSTEKSSTSKARHTPGPWNANELFIIEGSDGKNLAFPAIRPGLDETLEQGLGVIKANACLIAAAPEMLEDCKKNRNLLLEIAGVIMGGLGSLKDVEDLLLQHWDDVRLLGTIAKAEGTDE